MKLRLIVSLLVLMGMLSFGHQSILAKEKTKTIKRVEALNSVSESAAKGIIKISYREGETPLQRVQVLATGLNSHNNYSLIIDGKEVATTKSDRRGSLEFLLTSQAKESEMLLPRQLMPVTAIKNIAIEDMEHHLVLTGNLQNSDDGIGTLANVGDITVEVNKIVTVQIAANDPDGDPILFTVKCDKGNYVSILGVTLTVAPKQSDLGSTVCTLTATDKFNLSTESIFRVTVVDPSLPPTIDAVPDQTVRVGEVKRFIVQARDPNNDVLTLNVTNSTPALRSTTPNGGNAFTVELAPTADNQGGRVTLQVVDPKGLTGSTSFNIIVQKLVSITAVQRVKPDLFISGTGFGSSGAKVTINGVDVSAFIKGQSNNSITIRGTNKKLNLKPGANQVIVNAGGVASAAFILNI